MPASEVHNIDCLELMRTLPDKCFQLAIADPPYGGAGNEQFEGGGRFGQRFDRYKQASTSSSTAPARKTVCTSTEKLPPPPPAATQPRQRRKIRAIRRSRGKVHRLGCGTKAGVFRRAVSCGKDGHYLGRQLLSTASHKMLPHLGQETAGGFQYGNV